MEVYESSGSKLILKGTGEIKESLKSYLINKVTEYNTQLEAQTQKKNNGYYSSFSSQFNYLGQLDPLANPNDATHNYSLLEPDFFIGQLVQYLDTLENINGKTAIYGKNDANTDDEKLDMIANFLYQQNITRPEKLKQSTVIDDINETKASFDINYRISDVVSTYLTKDNDQGKFLTPTYSKMGYEVAYINSDGEDYVSAQSAPSFIKQIQQIQSTQTAPISANKFMEDATELQKDVDTCE